MKKMFLISCFIGIGISLLLTGCEWTSGGGVDHWNESADFIDVSGVYRDPEGEILVREFRDSSATNFITETLSASGDIRTDFARKLRHSPVPGTLIITVGAYIFTDETSGGTSHAVLTVNQSDGSSGTLNHDSAMVTLSFPAPLPAGARITATYLTLQTSSGQGNHGRAIYTFTVFQQGDRLTIVDSNGITYEGRLGNVRTTGGRPVEQSPQDIMEDPPSLRGGPVVAQFSATGVSQGYEVTLAGMFQGTLDLLTGLVFSERHVTGTYMEKGGYQADFFGIAGPGSAQ